MTGPSIRPTSHRAVGWIVGLALAAVSIPLQLLRQAGSRSWRTIWAEDGFEFYPRALDEGARALVTTYNGYLVTLPRLIAAPAPGIPMRWLAVYFSVVGALITVACAAAIYRLARGLVPSRPLRLVLAGVTMFAPLAGYELLANGVNTIWVLSFACLWGLLAVPKDTTDTVIAGIVVFLAAMSQVLVVLYVPLALALVWLGPRTRGRWIVMGCFSGGLALQALAVLLASGGPPGDPARLVDVAQVYGVHVVGTTLVGEPVLRWAWLQSPAVTTVATILAAGGLASVLLLRTRGRVRTVAALVVALSLVVLAVPIMIRGTTHMRLVSDEWTLNGSRFITMSSWILLSAAFILLSAMSMHDRTRRVVIAVTTAWIVVACVIGFRFDDLRSDAPSWPALVAQARVECERDPDLTVSLPINEPPVWAISVSCARLMRNG